MINNLVFGLIAVLVPPGALLLVLVLLLSCGIAVVRHQYRLPDRARAVVAWSREESGDVAEWS